MWVMYSLCQYLLFHVGDVQPVSVSSVSFGQCPACVSIFCFMWVMYSLCQYLLFHVGDVQPVSVSSVSCG